MKNAAELLVGAVARALADQRRVMLFGDSFELLQLLAEAPVKELVVVSTMVEEVDASGQTTLGAPLRLRPANEAKLKERASSKDLIVDLDGTASPADVRRLLKKAGIYLTAVPGPALGNLAEPTPIEGRFVTAVITEGGRPIPVRLDNGDATDPIFVHMAGKSHLIAPPGLICTLPASLAPASGDSSTSADATALAKSLEAQVVDAENRIAHLQGELDEAEAQLGEQTAALEAAEALGQRMLILEDDLMATRAKRDHAEAALAPLQAQLAEAEAAYESNRDELAERRVDDRRYASLRARFEAARAEMGAEIDELRAELLDVGGESEDVSALTEQRDAARQMFGLLTHRLVPALRAHLNVSIPEAPPVWATDAAQGWLDATCHLLARHAERPTITINTPAIEAPAAPVIGPAPAHPRTIALDDSMTQARIAALEAQLQAANAERAATTAAWQDRLAAADAALADREQLLKELRASHASARQARLAHLAAQAQTERLRAEVQLRDQRAGDLEGVIEAHVRMEGLLTEALDAAELVRDDAVTDQRALAANLRTLRAEFERAKG